MCGNISNVKISVIFRSSIPLNEFKNIIQRCSVSINKNSITIRGDYTIIIFYKKPSKYHVNVTKIKSLSEISIAVKYIRDKFFDSTNFELISQRIDNITSTFNLCKILNLYEIATKTEYAKFNPERFPGVYIKIPLIAGVGIVFSTGRVNVLGCSSESDILELWTKIKAII